MTKKVVSVFMTLVLALGLGATAFADTVRLKNGSVIKGQIVGFKDQQFVVLIAGSRGRQTRMTVFVEDVESIDFEGGGSNVAYNDNNNDNNTQPTVNPPVNTNTSYPPTTNPSNNNIGNSQPKNVPGFIPIKTVKVLADNTSNGWTSTGYVVRRGQLIRITGSGRIGLGSGRFASPGGISTLPDAKKLMKNDPTGALLAVVGDDNNDFIFVGGKKEFRSDRDGILFLGINEDNLNDNTGSFDAVIEIEAVDNP